jgi:nucleotide-binding universal stress UspA family protein
MHSHILIPVSLDHEGLVPQKLETARRLLADGGKITLLTVLEDIPGFVSEFVTVKSENHLTAKIRAKLETLDDGAGDIAVDVTTGKPGIRIVEYAKDHRVDLIVVGDRHPRAQDIFLGSTAARVARRASCPVYILR